MFVFGHILSVDIVSYKLIELPQLTRLLYAATRSFEKLGERATCTICKVLNLIKHSGVKTN